VRTLSKNFLAAVKSYSANPNAEALQEAQTRLSAAFSKIDKAVKKGVLHSNNGARRKSRLALILKKSQPQVAA
jgi:small subunit ribosomal protein S20